MKIGDNIKLIKINNWKGWGFENSFITNIGKTLIQIKVTLISFYWIAPKGVFLRLLGKVLTPVQTDVSCLKRKLSVTELINPLMEPIEGIILT